MVGAEPGFELREMYGVLDDFGEGNLMSAPEVFDFVAVDFFGSGPAFGGAEDDEGPTGAVGTVICSGFGLDAADLIYAEFESGGHALVAVDGVVCGEALYSVGIVAVAAEEVVELFAGDAGEDGGVRDFVTVQVKYWEDGAVGDGVEEFVSVPGGGEGAGLGFAVADAAGDEKVGVVEGGSVGVGEGVAEFAAFVDGAGVFRSAVTADSAWKRELLEELEEAGFVLGFVVVDLGVGAFEIGVGESGGCSVSGAGDVDGVEVVLFDEAIHVDPDEGLAGIGAPVAEEASLDVLGLEGFAQGAAGWRGGRSCCRRDSCRRSQ